MSIVILDDATHILIIDDDSRIRTLLSRYLRDNGYRVSSASSATEVVGLMELFVFDLLVVDIMLPGQSGIELVTNLKSTTLPSPPVLFLTALSEPNDRIKGLEVGGDDYLTKPFKPRELLLRINNILKRLPTADNSTDTTLVVFGDYSFDLKCETLLNGDDQVVKLSERERNLMSLFAKRAGMTIARAELLSKDEFNNERTIDVQINRLRRKIERDPSNPRYLLTVRGIGYKLVID